MKREWAIYDSDVGTLHFQPLIYGSGSCDRASLT